MLGLNPWTAEMAPDDREWLGHLFESWQLLADLSFSDVVCWVPNVDDSTLLAIAQARPATGPTALLDDVVGQAISNSDDPVAVAFRTGAVAEAQYRQRPGAPATLPVDVKAIPVRRDGTLLAVVSRHTNRLSTRNQGPLETVYHEVTSVLEDMLYEAHFPFVLDDAEPSHSPTVGDGVIRLDQTGHVTYASPNAQTSFRRLGLVGQFEGELFSDVAIRLSDEHEPIDRARFDVHHQRFLDSRVLDISNERAVVRVLVVPMTTTDYVGALVLARDITDIRLRERELITKDATIREIHHRVKNNLQTVSALLRLQSRRIDSPDAKCALAKAQQRVSAIGIVHELLSQSYDDDVAFDGVCDRLLSLTGAVTPTTGTVSVTRHGSFGIIAGDAATPLSLIISELCQNAAEHGLHQGPGTITVRALRDRHGLVVEIRDAGASKDAAPEPLPGQESSGLGLTIVSTLVAELDGTFDLVRAAVGATARVVIPAERIDARRESWRN